MASASSPKAEFGLWSVEGVTPRIAYSVSTLKALQQEAVEGLKRMRHGGVEVGGVLFGTRRGDLVTISDFRPLACEYATGPTFTLSEGDEARLKDLLAAARRDPGLSGLEAVGWYHSHTRSEVHLSDKDLDIYNRFFPESWQVAVVLKPAAQEPTRVGFFVREKNGEVRTESSYSEVPLPPILVPRLVFPEAAGRSSPQGEAARPSAAVPSAAAPEIPTPPAAETPAVQADSEPLRPRPSGWRYLLAFSLAVASIATAVLAYVLVRRNMDTRRVLLAVADVGGQLRIQWNRQADAVRAAQRGSLDVSDGGNTVTLPLDKLQLQAGHVVYSHRSGKVLVKLSLEGEKGQIAQEYAQFLDPQRKPPPEIPPQVEPQQADSEASRMRASLEEKEAELLRLQQLVEQLSREPPAREPKPVNPALAPTGDAAGRKAGSQSLPAGRSPQKLPPAGPVAQLNNPPATSQAAPTPPPEVRTETVRPTAVPPALPRQGEQAPPPPPPAAAPVEAPRPDPAPAPPASGRMIWTGRLRKGEMVAIDGSRASVGAVTGSLPGEPVTVTAYPADLTPQGIIVYTALYKYARPVTERPSAENGWNQTTYTMDFDRAGWVRILEAPSPENRWTRLVLRSEGSRVSLIFIEWRAVR